MRPNDETQMTKAEARSRADLRPRFSFSLAAALLAIGLLQAAGLSALGMSGTDQVAWPGKPVAAETDWPVGTADLANDPVRAAGWNPWFSEWPNDVNHYEFKPQSSQDVNRLLTRLAAIQAPQVCLILSPEPEPRGLGFTTVLGRSNGVAAVFALGSQRRIDEWYQRLAESVTGERQFGVHKLTAPPKALPPTLTLYVGQPVVDLQTLAVPARIEVTTNRSAQRADAPTEARIEAIAAFLARRLPAPGATKTPPPSAERAAFTNPLHPSAAR
jgi:hypothetical protein